MADTDSNEWSSIDGISWHLFGEQLLISSIVLLVIAVTYAVLSYIWEMIREQSLHDGKDSWRDDFLKTAESFFGTPEESPDNSVLYDTLTWTQLVLGCLTVWLWVYKTYEHEVASWIVVLEYVTSAIHILHYLSSSCRHRFSVRYVFSTESLVDIYTITPILLQGHVVKTWLSLSYLRILQVLASFLELQQGGSFYRLSALIRGGIEVTVKFISLVVIMAGSLFLLEALGDIEAFTDEYTLNQAGSVISFYRMVFFIFVTISTVGYGDFTPDTVFGRWSVIVFILSGILFFSVETGRMLELKSLEENGEGKLKLQSRVRKHIVVFGGAVNNSSVVTVQAFLSEIIFGAKTPLEIPQIVLMARNPISQDFHEMLRLPWAVQHVKWLRGTPLKPADLDRVRIGKAQMVFVLSDMSAQHADAEDEDNIMRALAVVRQYPKINYRVLLLRPENRSTAVRCRIKQSSVYAINELKASLLGLSNQIPCFSSVVMNLFCRGDPIYKGHIDQNYLTNENNGILEDSRMWVAEYARGAAKSLHLVLLKDEYSKLGCLQASIRLYNECGAILMAIQYNGEVRINPGHDSLCLQPNSPVFLIAASTRAISNVTKELSKGMPTASKVFLKNKAESLEQRYQSQFKIRATGHSAVYSNMIDEGSALGENNSGPAQTKDGTTMFKLPGMLGIVGGDLSKATTRKRASETSAGQAQPIDMDGLNSVDPLDGSMFDSRFHEETLALWVEEGGHVIVLLTDSNLWQQVVAFVQAVHAPHIPIWQNMVIITPHQPPQQLKQKIHGAIWVYSGLHNHETLNVAGVRTADKIVVFSGRPNSEETLNMDQRTLLTINYLEGLFTEWGLTCHFLTEFHNPDSINQLVRHEDAAMPQGRGRAPKDHKVHPVDEETEEPSHEVKASQAVGNQRLHPRFAAGHAIYRPDIIRSFANACTTPGILELFEALCQPVRKGQASMVWELKYEQLVKHMGEAREGSEAHASSDITFGQAFKFLTSNTTHSSSELAVPFAIVRGSGNMKNALEYPVTCPPSETSIMEGDSILVLASAWWARTHVYKEAILEILYQRQYVRKIWSAFEAFYQKTHAVAKVQVGAINRRCTASREKSKAEQQQPPPEEAPPRRDRLGTAGKGNLNLVSTVHRVNAARRFPGLPMSKPRK